MSVCCALLELLTPRMIAGSVRGCQQLELNHTVFARSQVRPRLAGVLPNARRTAYLLPGFDEYLLGYKDRSAALEPQYGQKTFLGSDGTFSGDHRHLGCVVGTWKRALKKNEVVITASPFSSLTKAEKNAYRRRCRALRPVCRPAGDHAI